MEILVVIGLVLLVLFIIGSSSAQTAPTPEALHRPAAAHMGFFEIRTIRQRMNVESPESPMVLAIEARGVIPVVRPTRLRFVTSVFDATDAQAKPVLCTIEALQESDSLVFQHSNDAPVVGPGQGFASWTRVGVVVPDALVPPRRGKRRLSAAVRLVDADRPPPIAMGFSDGRHVGMIHMATTTFEHEYGEMGYEEEASGRDEGRRLAVTVAVAVAMADGSLARAEGDVIEKWIDKMCNLHIEERRAEVKRQLESSREAALSLANGPGVSLSQVTARMREVAPKAQKVEMLELLFDVMAADGVAAESELQAIRSIAEALDVGHAIVEGMRDRRLINLKPEAQDASIESIIGIEPDWDRERILKRLRHEFQKWSDRVTVLEPGAERDNAQRMLDMIGEARTRYRRHA